MNLLDLKALSAAHAAMHLAEMVLDERVKMLERVGAFKVKMAQLAEERMAGE